jgi:hypothetical protein
LGIKNNKATGFDGASAETRMMICTIKEEIQIATNTFDKIKNRQEFIAD